MAKYRALIIAGGAFFALARSAGAADLLPPPPALEPPPPAAMEFNGWYLRGDVGIGISANTPEHHSIAGPCSSSPIWAGWYNPAATKGFYNSRFPPLGSSISASAISSTIGFASTSLVSTAADRACSHCM